MDIQKPPALSSRPIQRKPVPRHPVGAPPTVRGSQAGNGDRRSTARTLGVQTQADGDKLGERVGRLDLGSGEATIPQASQFFSHKTATSTWTSTTSTESLASTASTASASTVSTATTCSTSTSTTHTTRTADLGAKPKEGSFWKSALEETRFLAAGLVPKACAATKHYAVVRHAIGFVLYRGPSTSVAMTVFAAPERAPLPADRTVWLQRRGLSGDMGLRLKTLVGASDSWLDVTPARRAAVSELAAADERGYQRDIGRVLQRARRGTSSSDKALARQVPCETMVVRIPAAAADGYFRLVVCTGGAPSGSGLGPVCKRKVLCGSPVFRVASTSADASVFRGASLRTLPLEAGVKIVSFVGTTAVATWTEPLVAAVQAQVERLQPGTLQTMAAQEVYGHAGLQQRIEAGDARYEAEREAAYQVYSYGEDAEHDAPPEVVGADAGPAAPFPVSLTGRVVPGTGRSGRERGVPTANVDAPDKVRLRLRGVYFGWALVTPAKGAAEDGRVPRDWTEALVTVAPSPWAPPTVAARRDVAVHLLYDLGGASLVGAKLEAVVMGNLRAATADGAEAVAEVEAVAADARVAVTSLSRPHWGPQATLARMATAASGRSLADRYADTRGRLQMQVDRLPLHLAGVRTAGGALRDQEYGNGGFYVVRS